MKFIAHHLPGQYNLFGFFKVLGFSVPENNLAFLVVFIFYIKREVIGILGGVIIKRFLLIQLAHYTQYTFGLFGIVKRAIGAGAGVNNNNHPNSYCNYHQTKNRAFFHRSLTLIIRGTKIRNAKLIIFIASD